MVVVTASSLGSTLIGLRRDDLCRIRKAGSAEKSAPRAPGRVTRLGFLKAANLVHLHEMTDRPGHHHGVSLSLPPGGIGEQENLIFTAIGLSEEPIASSSSTDIFTTSTIPLAVY